MSNAEAPVVQEEIDLAAANRVIDKYINMKGALMPVLQEVQDEYGFLPEPCIHLIAEAAQCLSESDLWRSDLLCSVSSGASRQVYCSRVHGDGLSR
jgi:hypothetical protein